MGSRLQLNPGRPICKTTMPQYSLDLGLGQWCVWRGSFVPTPICAAHSPAASEMHTAQAENDCSTKHSSGRQSQRH